MRHAPRLAILYHFYAPDDVVSAQLYAQLAEDLAGMGWTVDVFTSNRSCFGQRKYEASSELAGVQVHRSWRPAWEQASAKGRLANAAWMMGAWVRQLAGKTEFDVVLLGTDPVFSVLLAPILRRLGADGSKAPKIVHWVFDMYPDAALADGLLRPQHWALPTLERVLRRAYRSCDLVADLGPCMRARLDRYGMRAQRCTITPWALREPPAATNSETRLRNELFGDATLGVLYSGSFGRAHEYRHFLELARQLRDTSVAFCFAARGNRMDELKAAVTAADVNVRFAGFASEAELEQRLAAADVHLVSLRPGWEGIVVPSKFFGALAVGRPILYDGPPESSVALWIKKYGLGWTLNEQSLRDVAHDFRQLTHDAEARARLQKHCHAAYQSHFARRQMTERWNDELRGLLTKGPSQNAP